MASKLPDVFGSFISCYL